MSGFISGDWVRVMDGTVLARAGSMGARDERVSVGDVIGKVVQLKRSTVLIRLVGPDANRTGMKEIEVATECLVPFSLEAQLARVAFAMDDASDDGTGYPEVPYRERDGIEVDPITGALLTLTLSPHTRWALATIDPKGLRQAQDALLQYRKVEESDGTGKPVAAHPDLRALMLERLDALGEFQRERFEWVEDPSAAPEWAQPALQALGPVLLKRWWIDEINRSSLELLAIEEILVKAGIIVKGVLTDQPDGEGAEGEE